MFRRFRSLLVALAITLMPLPALAQAAPAQPALADITSNIDDLFRSSASVARMEVTIVTPRQTRTMRMRMWARGEERALIVIESPARD